MGKGTFGRIGLGGAIGCVAVGAVLLGGCGGGSDSTTGASGASGASGTPLSQDEFVSQGNAICAETNKQVEALKAPAANSTPADQLPTLEQDVKIATDTFAKMGALTPPSDLQAQYDQFLQNANDQIAQANQLVAAVKANDSAKIQSIATKLNSTNASSDAAAKDLGLTECAKDARPQG